MTSNVNSSSFVIRTIDLGGQTVRTAVRPGKPQSIPLLVFTGIGASLELLFPFVDALDPDQEVIAFDVPGVGGSSTPMWPYSFCSLAKTVTRMLDYLNYGQVDVIGVSWGGFLAQQFAHDYPHRCQRLILAATSTGMAMVPPSLKVFWLMSSPLRYTNSKHGAKIAPDIYGGMFRHDKKLAEEHAIKMKSSGGLGYYYQMLAVYFWTSIHWLRKIKQPTLVLAGNDDPLIPLINMQLMAKIIPNSELHVIDDGHLFLLTQMDTVIPIITQFLEDK